MVIAVEDSSLHTTVYRHCYARFPVISTFTWFKEKNDPALKLALRTVQNLILISSELEINVMC